MILFLFSNLVLKCSSSSCFGNEYLPFVIGYSTLKESDINVLAYDQSRTTLYFGGIYEGKIILGAYNDRDNFKGLVWIKTLQDFSNTKPMNLKLNQVESIKYFSDRIYVAIRSYKNSDNSGYYYLISLNSKGDFVNGIWIQSFIPDKEYKDMMEISKGGNIFVSIRKAEFKSQLLLINQDLKKYINKHQFPSQSRVSVMVQKDTDTDEMYIGGNYNFILSGDIINKGIFTANIQTIPTNSQYTFQAYDLSNINNLNLDFALAKFKQGLFIGCINDKIATDVYHITIPFDYLNNPNDKSVLRFQKKKLTTINSDIIKINHLVYANNNAQEYFFSSGQKQGTFIYGYQNDSTIIQQLTVFASDFTDLTDDSYQITLTSLNFTENIDSWPGQPKAKQFFVYQDLLVKADVHYIGLIEQMINDEQYIYCYLIFIGPPCKFLNITYQMNTDCDGSLLLNDGLNSWTLHEVTFHLIICPHSNEIKPVINKEPHINDINYKIGSRFQQYSFQNIEYEPKFFFIKKNEIIFEQGQVKFDGLDQSLINKGIISINNDYNWQAKEYKCILIVKLNFFHDNIIEREIPFRITLTTDQTYSYLNNTAPYFIGKLNDIDLQIDQNFNYQLPQVIDDEMDDYTISFESKFGSMLMKPDGNVLTFTPQLQLIGSHKVKIVIKDKNAFPKSSNYEFIITINPKSNIFEIDLSAFSNEIQESYLLAKKQSIKGAVEAKIVKISHSGEVSIYFNKQMNLTKQMKNMIDKALIISIIKENDNWDVLSIQFNLFFLFMDQKKQYMIPKSYTIKGQMPPQISEYVQSTNHIIFEDPNLPENQVDNYESQPYSLFFQQMGYNS
ncbi:cadg domain containing protein [Stylonychia lemnae]|uniref:Cadg domain containing protein n=1 Tax=Stylonychia lemnae TaxID=5949 RepID=A0A078APP9_STYLE|nr:cadg domain containing protein [Stylonychia lemnae]|eukprot:CDW82883.1 cadg domain containing protein [Stylonychia lemnae]